MFRGVETITYYVEDLAKAAAWYKTILALTPNHESEHYVGFTVGGYELGLHPVTELCKPGTNGQTAYWSVDNVAEAVTHLTKNGAKLGQPAQDVGGGITVAAVRDPFGNLFGVIANPKSPNRKK